MQQRQIEEETAIPAEDLGIWPDIVGTGGENQNWEWQKTRIQAKMGKRGKF